MEFAFAMQTLLQFNPHRHLLRRSRGGHLCSERGRAFCLDSGGGALFDPYRGRAVGGSRRRRVQAGVRKRSLSPDKQRQRAHQDKGHPRGSRMT